jgi:hypothetical protein
MYEPLQRNPCEKIFDDRPEPDPNIPPSLFFTTVLDSSWISQTVATMSPGLLILML